MYKFKVGDKVICNKYASSYYALSKYKSEGTIVNVYENHARIKFSKLTGLFGREHIGETYNIEYRFLEEKALGIDLSHIKKFGIVGFIDNVNKGTYIKKRRKK